MHLHIRRQTDQSNVRMASNAFNADALETGLSYVNKNAYQMFVAWLQNYLKGRCALVKAGNLCSALMSVNHTVILRKTRQISIQGFIRRMAGCIAIRIFCCLPCVIL